MNPVIRVFVVAVLLAAPPCVLGADDASTSAFLQELSVREGFVITGLSHVRGDRFQPPARETDTDRLLSRALARYNHLVSYRGARVSRVDIFGRKGRDVGALPEEVTAGDPAEPDESLDQIQLLVSRSTFSRTRLTSP